MHRIALILGLIISSAIYGQNALDSLGRDEEMGLKDKHGYFFDKNAIKYNPVFSAFGGDDLIMGHAFSFEFGNITRKFSLNITVRQFDGFIEYGKVSEADLTDPLDQNTSTAMIVDSSHVVNAIPANLRYEIMPRFYFLEDIGLYIGPYFAIAKNLETEEFRPILGFSSGLSVVIAERFNLDLSLGIQYDDLGTGSSGDLPVELRPYAGVGYVLPIKDPHAKTWGKTK